MTHLTTGPSPSSSSAHAEALTLLGPEVDPSTMAPSTLILALRKKRREAKREQRSDVRRSNLRASTLKTEAEIAEREIKAREAVKTSRKGRKALHEGGEARGVRNLSQAELIAEALEEEERNKEELRKWLRREEERRELRRVGRKRVRGPRWTWISRTVGKVVEVIETEGQVEARTAETTSAQEPASTTKTTGETTGESTGETAGESIKPTANDTTTAEIPPTPSAAAPHPSQSVVAGNSGGEPSPEKDAVAAGINEESPAGLPQSSVSTAGTTTINTSDDTAPKPTTTTTTPIGETDTKPPSNHSGQDPKPVASTDTAALRVSATPLQPTPAPMLQSATTPNQPAEPSQYTRNYLVLSQIPGGLPAELALVLGGHVAWDEVKYIPGRNRPINRRPPICPFTGKVARYRHPATMIPYADARGYKEIEAMLRNRYIWSEGGFWVGGEEDVSARGVGEIEGWAEAVHGGWMGGFAIPQREAEEEAVVAVEEDETMEAIEPEDEVVIAPIKKSKSKSKKRSAKSETTASEPVKGKKKRK